MSLEVAPVIVIHATEAMWHTVEPKTVEVC
jgi:hypothetical protein